MISIKDEIVKYVVDIIRTVKNVDAIETTIIIEDDDDTPKKKRKKLIEQVNVV